MVYRAYRDPIFELEWRVDAVDGDGHCYSVIFCGPYARDRAKEYAEWKNGGNGWYPPPD